MSTNRRLAAIMFTDIVGYSAMMQRDEAGGVASVKRYREVLEQRVAAHGGNIHQHYGDGSLSIFSSAVEAVNCAKEVQQILMEEPRVVLRTGIHIGDIMLESGHIYGDGVNLASRVESLAVPGSVLITERVIQDIRNHPEFQTISLGKFTFRNISQPTEVFALANEGFPVPTKQDLRSNKSEAVPLDDSPAVRPWKSWAMLTGALALAVALGFMLDRFLVNPPKKIEEAPIPEQSIAVLPFKDLSPQGDQAFFSDGIAEEILNALAQVEGVKVAGRTSSFSFRGQEVDLREIAQKLGVASVLEGSVRKSGDRVRITAQLVSAKDGYQLWSESFDRQLSDIFSVQEEIAQAVVGNLVGVLMPKESQALVKSPTQNPEAYENYLQGRYLLSQRSDGAQKAVGFFEEAIALDSQFAMAYAGLGNSFLWQAWGGFQPSHEAFPEAMRYAREALRHDSTLAYAWSIVGAVHLWYDWDWPAARGALEKAISLNPSEARAYLDLGWYYAISGDFDRAFEFIGKAVTLDPLNLEYNIDQADLLRMAGRNEQAGKVAANMLELYPGNSEVYWISGMIDYDLVRYARALKSFQQAVEYSEGEPWALIHLYMAQARAGKRTEARTSLENLIRDDGTLVEILSVELAMAYLAMDDREQALQMLERSFQLRANWLISLKMDPVWKPLHNNLRYKEIIRKMNFP
jgi:adenylate cyclase